VQDFKCLTNNGDLHLLLATYHLKFLIFFVIVQSLLANGVFAGS